MTEHQKLKMERGINIARISELDRQIVEIRSAASVLGKIKSAKKAAASAANGKRGGRPKISVKQKK